MDIGALKYEIFAKIFNLNSEDVLLRIKENVDSLSKDEILLSHIIKPLKEKTSLEDMIQEQNYKGFDRAGFDRIIKEMDIQDPIEELLAINTP